MNRQKLREFLKKNADRGEIFLAGDTCACPLAMYLQSEGELNPRIYSESYLVNAMDIPAKFIELPKWAQLFVIGVDDTDDEEVSAQKCLEILDDIKGEQ